MYFSFSLCIIYWKKNGHVYVRLRPSQQSHISSINRNGRRTRIPCSTRIIRLHDIVPLKTNGKLTFES